MTGLSPCGVLMGHGASICPRLHREANRKCRICIINYCPHIRSITPERRLDRLEPLMADALQKIDRLIEGQGKLIDMVARADQNATNAAVERTMPLNEQTTLPSGLTMLPGGRTTLLVWLRLLPKV